jgi:hypothetical protein
MVRGGEDGEEFITFTSSAVNSTVNEDEDIERDGWNALLQIGSIEQGSYQLSKDLIPKEDLLALDDTLPIHDVEESFLQAIEKVRESMFIC